MERLWSWLKGEDEQNDYTLKKSAYLTLKWPWMNFVWSYNYATFKPWGVHSYVISLLYAASNGCLLGSTWENEKLHHD